MIASRNTHQESYLKRQLTLLSNLGIFYLVIISLLGIPLFGTVIVLLIKGALEYRYEIMAGGITLFLIILYLLYRAVRRFTKRVKSDGSLVGHEVMEKMQLGQPVSVSLFKGLFTFTYGGNSKPSLKNALEYQNPPKALTTLTAEVDNGEMPSVINQLRELSQLRDQNVIDEEELLLLKSKLLRKDT